MPSEFERIDVIRARAARPSRSVTLGIGDDAALLRPEPGFETAISADLLVESVHFRVDWSTPELLGRKSLAVSLSDMAAMGAIPRAALLSLALPDWVDEEFLDGFYTGALSICDRFGVPIVGGDMSRSPGPLVVDSVLVGEVEAGRALRRSGARAGDALYVSGSLGSAAAGLDQLRSGVTLENAATGVNLDAIRNHLAPSPRVELGRALVTSGIATAAIDLSDGLSSDLRHVCEASGIGACVYGASLPTKYSLEHALHGGEQYELLFAASPLNAERISAIATGLKLDITRIGYFEGPPDQIVLAIDGRREPLRPLGWDHFSKA